MNIGGTTLFFFLNYSLPLVTAGHQKQKHQVGHTHTLYCLNLDELGWLTPQDFVLIQYIYVLNFKYPPKSGYKTFDWLLPSILDTSYFNRIVNIKGLLNE